MNPWLSRATEKLHFARLALAEAARATADGTVASRPQVAMLEEAAMLHAWGGCLALLNGIAVQLNLPASETPDLQRLLRMAKAGGVHAEALGELDVLRSQPDSWYNLLESKARATWQLRARQEPTLRQPGLIASSMPAEEPVSDDPEALVAAASDFLDRHSATMEEW